VSSSEIISTLRLLSGEALLALDLDLDFSLLERLSGVGWLEA